MKKIEELISTMTERYNEVSFMFNCAYAQWMHRGETRDWDNYQFLMGEMQTSQILIEDIMVIYGMAAEYDLKHTEIMIDGDRKEIIYMVIRIIK